MGELSGCHPEEIRWHRITVNYKKLNQLSILGQLPILRVDEVLDKLGTDRIFSLFDLVFSFHQITVHKDTTSHCFMHTHPSLRVAGNATRKQRCSRVIRQGHLEGVSAYLDDVIVFGADPSIHVTNMKVFFLRLRKHKLKLSPSKATIGATDANFLGHTISPAGIMPNAQKVEALMKMLMPEYLKELRSLLGSLSYYRKLLRDMAKRVRPITSLLKQGVKFVFTPAMEAIVLERLAELSTPLVLVYPNRDGVTDNSHPFLIYCDASVDGFGATLEQEQDDHTIRPIVFYQPRYHRV